MINLLMKTRYIIPQGAKCEICGNTNTKDLIAGPFIICWECVKNPDEAEKKIQGISHKQQIINHFNNG